MNNQVHSIRSGVLVVLLLIPGSAAAGSASSCPAPSLDDCLDPVYPQTACGEAAARSGFCDLLICAALCTAFVDGELVWTCDPGGVEEAVLVPAKLSDDGVDHPAGSDEVVTTHVWCRRWAIPAWGSCIWRPRT